MDATPRSEYETTESYLEALDLEAAVRRDNELTARERAAANRAMAEHFGTYWRPEWVVS